MLCFTIDTLGCPFFRGEMYWHHRKVYFCVLDSVLCREVVYIVSFNRGSTVYTQNILFRCDTLIHSSIVEVCTIRTVCTVFADGGE